MEKKDQDIALKQYQFRQAARGICKPRNNYDELKKHHAEIMAEINIGSDKNLETQKELSDTLSDKTEKVCQTTGLAPAGSAQVGSFVRQPIVRQNSCELKHEGNRPCRLMARFTWDERREVLKRSQEAHLTLSEYVRLALLRLPAIDPARHRLLMKANYELNRQGNNLNQITKKLHAAQIEPEKTIGLLDEMFDSFMEAHNAIHDALAEEGVSA